MPISPRHEELLYQELRTLEKSGYKVLALGKKQPDAIVISPDNQIIAVEVLGKKRRRDHKGRSKGYAWDGGKGIQHKRWIYGHYDDIIFILFDRSGSDWQQRILASNEWPDMWEYEGEKRDSISLRFMNKTRDVMKDGYD